MVNKRMSRTTRSQYSTILDILERHQQQGVDITSQKSVFIWEEIVAACNQEQPNRDLNGWRKAFCDWKYLTKRKFLDPSQAHLINKEERRLDRLLGLSPPEMGAVTPSTSFPKRERSATKRKAKVEEEEDSEDDWPLEALEPSPQKSPPRQAELESSVNPAKRIKIEANFNEESEDDEAYYHACQDNKPDWNRLYQILEERNRIERAKLAIRKNKYLLLKKVFLSKDDEDPLSELIAK